MSPDPLPETVGPYRVESELGRGMMGVVYKARDTRRGRGKRTVALKVIRMAFAVSEEQRASFERRFLEEARIVSGLSHPGIVGVHDMGHDDRLDAPYIAFEFLQGRTLAEILAEGPRLTWHVALRVVARVAEALHYAHGRGVVHRDIKPANIMVLPSGQPKIMDFGLAKLDAGLELTSTGQWLGTPLYMAPEQSLGARVDGRTDLFSLGSVAYTVLTGKRAFEAESVPQVLNRVAYQHPPPPTQLAPALPADVDYLLARAMAKAPGERYADGKAMAEDVEDVVQGKRPRHRRGWKPVVVGDGTTVASRHPSLEASMADLELEPVVEAPRRRTGKGAGPVAVLGLSMLALGAVFYTSAFWREQIALRVAEVLPAAPAARATPAPPPPSPEAAPAEGLTHWREWPVPSAPSTMVAVGPAAVPSVTSGDPGLAPSEGTPGEATSVGDEPEGEDEEDPAPDAADPDPLPDVDDEAEPSAASQTPPIIATPPVPAPTPKPTTPPRPKPRPSAPATSKLSITFEHHIKSGRLRLWVDRKLVLEQRLTSRVTKDLLVFKLRSGKVQNVLPVVPGRRRVRVEVRTGDETRTKEIVGTFKSRGTRRLEIKIGRVGGSLSLAWR